MFYLMIFVFIVGYAAIALEHPLKVNKSATALLLGVLMWVLLMFGGQELLVNASSFKQYLSEVAGGNFADWLSHHALLEHLGEISEIIFFLLGAMTIVELVDSHEGFRIITDKIKTTKKVKLLWVTSVITFFMSAVLDNLTTSIVMVALLRKLIADKHDRWFYAGMVIVAANAGGAWSPIGDVTTIMLWIAGHVTTVNIIVKTFLPSLVSMLVPLAILSFTMKGTVSRPNADDTNGHGMETTAFERNFLFFLGVGSLLFVPVFKTFTHLPPFLGMLWGLGLLWLTTELLHKAKNDEDKAHLTIVGVLRKVDVPSILFFLGILTAVAALQVAGHLDLLSKALSEHVGNLYVINLIIGVLSSIVDNVPLVAGAMGMYATAFPTDHYFWEFLAYCAGTGGSILIIGSAAGVAVMGMEKIDFIWYLKKVSLLALVGYLAGGLVYIAQEESGILHTESHEVTAIDVTNPAAVTAFITSAQFSATCDGKTMTRHFIDYTEKGEHFSGIKTITASQEGDCETATLNHAPMKIESMGDKARIEIQGATYFLTTDGRLFEADTASTNGMGVEWKGSAGGH